MPTANPRITITLQPSVHVLLRRLSELTGNSQSALVGELLEQSSSIFERMVRILEAAEALKEQGRAVGEEFRESLAAAQSGLESQLGLALEALDEGEGRLLDVAEAVARRRAAGPRPDGRGASVGHGAAARGEPPGSNRGVGSPKRRAAARAKGATSGGSM